MRGTGKAAVDRSAGKDLSLSSSHSEALGITATTLSTMAIFSGFIQCPRDGACSGSFLMLLFLDRSAWLTRTDYNYNTMLVPVRCAECTLFPSSIRLFIHSFLPLHLLHPFTAAPLNISSQELYPLLVHHCLQLPQWLASFGSNYALLFGKTGLFSQNIGL